MFEPPENTPLGTLTVGLGVETVHGSAGIVSRDDAVTVYCILFDVQMEMTIQK